MRSRMRRARARNLIAPTAAVLALLILTPGASALSQVPGSPFAAGAGPYSLAFSPDGGLLATANNGSDDASLFSVSAAGALTPVAGSPFPAGQSPRSVAFSPSGRLLATAGNINGGLGTVSVFSVSTTGALTPVTGSSLALGGYTTSVAFSPSGRLLAVGTYRYAGSELLYSEVSVYSVSAAGELTFVASSPVPRGYLPESVTFSPSGGLLATANFPEGGVSVFAVNAAGALSPVAGSPFSAGRGQCSVAFSPSGALLASADQAGGGLSVFAVAAAGALTPVTGSPFATGTSACSVAFSPSGGLLATANSSDNFMVFSVSATGALTPVTGSPFTTGTGLASAVAFSPSGGLLATANGGSNNVSVFANARTPLGPVLIVHGIDALGPAAVNCAVSFDDAKRELRASGFRERDILTLAYYHRDADCDRSISGHVNPGLGNTYADRVATHVGQSPGHSAEAAIEHLAYHLAWFIYDSYSSRGVPVDILAHSMGGLIVRYALAHVEIHNPAFPPRLLVQDAVTLGTPHGGARSNAAFEGCRRFLNVYQCDQMGAGSPFLTGLERVGWNPQGADGTDWTTIGSDGDERVAADRAAATSTDRTRDQYFGACHKVWYPAVRFEERRRIFGIPILRRIEQRIGHSDYHHDGSISGGMDATDLLSYTEGDSCGAPLQSARGQRHPMRQAAQALGSPDD